MKKNFHYKVLDIVKLNYNFGVGHVFIRGCSEISKFWISKNESCRWIFETLKDFINKKLVNYKVVFDHYNFGINHIDV